MNIMGTNSIPVPKKANTITVSNVCTIHGRRTEVAYTINRNTQEINIKFSPGITDITGVAGKINKLLSSI